MCSGNGMWLVMTDDGPTFEGLVCEEHLHEHLASDDARTDTYAVDLTASNLSIVTGQPGFATGFAARLTEATQTIDALHERTRQAQFSILLAQAFQQSASAEDAHAPVTLSVSEIEDVDEWEREFDQD